MRGDFVIDNKFIFYYKVLKMGISANEVICLFIDAFNLLALYVLSRTFACMSLNFACETRFAVNIKVPRSEICAVYKIHTALQRKT